MRLLFDFFPILIFFICYKAFDLYLATKVAMVASLVQVIYFRLKNQSYEKMHLISMSFILVLGGATLFFHNPWFIKWKPTSIYWLSSLVLLGSCFIGKKTVIQIMMEDNINLPEKIWRRLNVTWAIFFALMGALNLYVAYNYDTDVWVNFKLFGGLGFTMFFLFLQAIYLTRHVIEDDLKKQPSGNQ